jgi:hypothetical protein
LFWITVFVPTFVSVTCKALDQIQLPAHTNTEDYPWLQVEFDQEKTILPVKIKSRNKVSKGKQKGNYTVI